MTDLARREKALREKYGIGQAQWDLMFERQKGKCPICDHKLVKPNAPGGKRASAVDHCHRTGRVRGLLCFRCNYRVIRRTTLDRARRVFEYLNTDFDGRDLKG